MQEKIIGGLKSYILFHDSEDSYPEYAVILVHGYGANGRDLMTLAQEWSPSLPSVMFIAPDAPDMCDDTPLGQQWFPLNIYSKEAMQEAIDTHWATLSNYIDHVIEEFSLNDRKIILCGFSQGTMMALHTALSRPKACAGVLGYSGMFLTPELAQETHHHHLPIHLIHGSADPIINVNEWENAMDVFTKHNFSITGYKSKGLGHSIDSNGIESGFYFIRDILF